MKKETNYIESKNCCVKKKKKTKNHNEYNIKKDYNNSIRKLSKQTKSWIMFMGIPEHYIGYYYQLLHYIIIFGGGFVILFNTNPYYLIVLLIIISLDAFANVVVHDCPLTALERKYLKASLSSERRDNFKKANIVYKCNHEYESQVELIVNMWTMVACKIVVILIMKSFTPGFILSCCG